MKRVCIALTLGLATATSALADDNNEELEQLRKELREAQRQLNDTSRRLSAIYRDRGVRPGSSFQFSYNDERPMVGVVMVANAGDRGVRLAGVTPGAPADDAGLQSGDVIVEINGHDLRGADAVEEAYELLDNMEEGDEFEFVYERDGKEQEVTLEAALHQPSYSFSWGGSGSGPAIATPNFSFDFGDMNVEQFQDWAREQRRLSLNLKDFQQYDIRPYIWQFGWAWSGLELAPLNEQLGRYFGTTEGALVIEAEGLEDSDLQGGDVILEINGRPVPGPREAMRSLRRLDAGDSVTVQIMRDQRRQDITVVVPEYEDGSSFIFSWDDD